MRACAPTSCWRVRAPEDLARALSLSLSGTCSLAPTCAPATWAQTRCPSARAASPGVSQPRAPAFCPIRLACWRAAARAAAHHPPRTRWEACPRPRTPRPRTPRPRRPRSRRPRRPRTRCQDAPRYAPPALAASTAAARPHPRAPSLAGLDRAAPSLHPAVPSLHACGSSFAGAVQQTGGAEACLPLQRGTPGPGRPIPGPPP